MHAVRGMTAWRSNRIMWFAAVLLLSCRKRPMTDVPWPIPPGAYIVEPQKRAEKLPRPGLDALGPALDRALSDAVSYHQLLRSATRIVREHFEGRDWTEVSAYFEQQGFRCTMEAWTYPHYARYVLKEKAYVLSSGRSHSLFGQFLVMDRAGLGASSPSSEPGKISSAWAGLSIEVDLPLAEAPSKLGYPPGTVVPEILGIYAANIADESALALKRIRISYDRCGDHNVKWHPFMFNVDLTLEHRRTGKSIRVSCRAESDLDPAESVEGAKVITPQTGQDTFRVVLITEEGRGDVWYDEGLW